MLEGDARHGERTAAAEHEGLTARQLRRLREREQWNAYYKFMDLESKGTILNRWRYLCSRAVDIPATWLREKIAEPLQDRYKMPYYHRRFARVKDIDQCPSSDNVCIYEANEQYRLDKAVDSNILRILSTRLSSCMARNLHNPSPCAQAMEDYEENELSWFIKYGELGVTADSRDVYMKQKHRLIWERRHPWIIESREKLLKEHKEKFAKGEIDIGFWKQYTPVSDKSQNQLPYFYYVDALTSMRPNALSKDPEYYKKARQDGVKNPEDPDDQAKFGPRFLGFIRPQEPKVDNPHKDKKPLNEL